MSDWLEALPDTTLVQLLWTVSWQTALVGACVAVFRQHLRTDEERHACAVFGTVLIGLSFVGNLATAHWPDPSSFDVRGHRHLSQPSSPSRPRGVTELTGQESSVAADRERTAATSNRPRRERFQGRVSETPVATPARTGGSWRWETRLSLAWLAGSLIMIVRLVWSACCVVRLVQLAEPAAASWQRLADRWARQFSGRGGLKVCTSRHVHDALVCGLLRPVILIPAGWLTQLSPDVLQIVMAHEIAHLRRGDLLILGYLRALESVLFFHPVVWWLSASIQRDREYCSDRLAAELVGDKLLYARGLEYIARQRVGKQHLAWTASLGGPRMSLAKRIRKVLETRTRERRLGWSLALLLVVGLPLALWSTDTLTRSTVWAQDGDRPEAGREREGDRPEARREREGDRDRPEARREGDGDRPEARREREGDRPEARREGERDRPEARREREGDRPEVRFGEGNVRQMQETILRLQREVEMLRRELSRRPLPGRPVVPARPTDKPDGDRERRDGDRDRDEPAGDVRHDGDRRDPRPRGDINPVAELRELRMAVEQLRRDVSEIQRRLPRPPVLRQGPIQGPPRLQSPLRDGERRFDGPQRRRLTPLERPESRREDADRAEERPRREGDAPEEARPRREGDAPEEARPRREGDAREDD